MKKSIHLALAVSGVLTLAACASGGGSGSSSGPVALVQVGAYTGDQAFEAQFANSIDYPALYAVNKAGGVLGRQVSLIQVDTRSDPADALTNMDKTLATSNGIAGVLGPDSTSAATLVPLLNNKKLPMMVAAGEAAYDRSSYPTCGATCRRTRLMARRSRSGPSARATPGSPPYSEPMPVHRVTCRVW
jgi:hypothetical protein